MFLDKPFWIGASAAVLAIGALAFGAKLKGGMNLMGSGHTGNVGTRPGDIGSGQDIDAVAKSRGHELATFAGGCFWHTEDSFRKIPGVVATAVGYSGGHTVNPTYRDVCTHTTGHAECVLVEFDPKQVSYKQLVSDFWSMIDPTQQNGQGPDLGANYRSIIFYHSAEQKQEAEESLKALDASGHYKKPIATVIEPEAKFYMAEDYHQQYFEKNGINACGIG